MLIVCVRTGTLYSPEYVEKLRDAVRPNPLLCITDQPEQLPGVATMPPPAGVSGWWTRMWLYSVEAPHPCLALDLDMIWLQDIGPFLNFNDPVSIHDFLPRGGRSLNMNGSFMGIPRPYPHVWETFLRDQKHIETTYPTDQHYIWHCNLPWTFYPDNWTASYRRGTVTPDTKVVVFHGSPKPHEVNWTLRAPNEPPGW